MVAGGVCGCEIGMEPGRSGVPCDENLELRLFIHDCRFEGCGRSPFIVVRSALLDRASRLGRFVCNACGLVDGGVGVLEYALVTSLVGSTGVGGVT